MGCCNCGEDIPVFPSHPIVIPPGVPPLYPAHPIVIPPGSWYPHPSHPIVQPPLSVWGGGGVGNYPDAGFPGPQPGPGRPTHPIYWPNPHPEHPIVLPPTEPDPPPEGIKGPVQAEYVVPANDGTNYFVAKPGASLPLGPVGYLIFPIYPEATHQPTEPPQPTEPQPT